MRRAALWTAVAVLLGSILASVAAAPTADTTTYTLTGFVDQPGGVSAPPVPAGVTVELVSAATGTVYKTTTAAGGVFSFTASDTDQELKPGYWRLLVPTVANVSVSGCGKCAVLPEHQNPSVAYYSAAELTDKAFEVTIPNVAVYPYNATQNGTVYQGAQIVPGVKVSLLDPNFNGLVLANATTNASGEYTMKAPHGDWVMQAVHVSGENTFTNTTRDDITVAKPPLLNPVLVGLTISGWINSTTGRVTTAGNATLYDPTNGYIYSATTPAGGYYSLPTYLAGFTHGPQAFDVILSANGYGSTHFPLTVSTTAAQQHNVIVKNLTAAERGNYTTTLDFSKINPATGKGTLTVTTDVRLGNDSVVPNLPNGTVGQLWAQLGLDFNHSLVFPNATDIGKLEALLNARGPFFLTTQAQTTINATGFAAITKPPALASFDSHCAVSCGLSSPAGIDYSWNETYTFNGTLQKNAPSYVIDFTFQHPSAPSSVYNYSLLLPKGYVLSASTEAPSHTTLTPTGPSKTWGKFILSSTAWTTPSATAKFTIVKTGDVKPIVNVTSTNFTFSKANVLNSTRGNYTVVLGLDENATFSAANSIYNASTNGSLFSWNFGDGTTKTTANTSLNYTYKVATPTGGFWQSGFYNGTLNITTSGGRTNTTHFHVWVVTSTPTAVISSNATTAEMQTTTGATPTKYLEVNWSTTLAFNANASTVPHGNVKSIAYFELSASKTIHKSANYSVAAGAIFGTNWSVDFNPPKTIGTAHYIKTDALVGGTDIPFLGWEYNLTLKVWSGTGTFATTSLAILLKDTQKPVPSFTVLNSAGKAITGDSIIEGSNGKAKVELDAAASEDPNNGSIKSYSWHITNGNNTTLVQWHNQTTVKPYPAFELLPETKAYTINLTVEDLAGNKANHTMSLTVSVNATTRPVMNAAVFTGPSSLTEGKSATFWLNVTNKGGKDSYAKDVNVSWYVLSASGTGSKRYVAGSPTSTVFYNYSSGVVVSTKAYSSTYPSLAFNKTVRAEITWTPSFSGNYVLYANVTAVNEFKPDYHGSPNIVSMSIAIHPNPTTQALEYGGIAAAVIIAIGLLIWWTRRSGRRGTAKTSGKAGLERGGSKKPDADEDDDEP